MSPAGLFTSASGRVTVLYILARRCIASAQRAWRAVRTRWVGSIDMRRKQCVFELPSRGSDWTEMMVDDAAFQLDGGLCILNMMRNLRPTHLTSGARFSSRAPVCRRAPAAQMGRRAARRDVARGTVRPARHAADATVARAQTRAEDETAHALVSRLRRVRAHVAMRHVRAGAAGPGNDTPSPSDDAWTDRIPNASPQSDSPRHPITALPRLPRPSCNAAARARTPLGERRCVGSLFAPQRDWACTRWLLRCSGLRCCRRPSVL